MVITQERYLVDENGRRIAVLLEIEQYYRLLEQLEELEAIQAYNEAKAANDEVIPFELAVAEIERSRR